VPCGTGGHKSLNLDTSELLNPNDAAILGTSKTDNMLRRQNFYVVKI
ncbi:hypothetical protein LCGC14_1627740, partial [marine sediment metagenome]